MAWHKHAVGVCYVATPPDYWRQHHGGKSEAAMAALWRKGIKIKRIKRHKARSSVAALAGENAGEGEEIGVACWRHRGSESGGGRRNNRRENANSSSNLARRGRRGGNSSVSSEENIKQQHQQHGEIALMA